jgi:hypothetical protein
MASRDGSLVDQCVCIKSRGAGSLRVARSFVVRFTGAVIVGRAPDYMEKGRIIMSVWLRAAEGRQTMDTKPKISRRKVAIVLCALPIILFLYHFS